MNTHMQEIKAEAKQRGIILPRIAYTVKRKSQYVGRFQIEIHSYADAEAWRFRTYTADNVAQAKQYFFSDFLEKAANVVNS